MTARVSVIVPTYNRADLIGLTLRSVLAQSVAPVEIIVVDDGSRDNTAEVVATFGDVVRYVTQANAGVAAARNHGARLAAGDYLAFTDSDDLWHPLKLEAQLAALAATPAAQWSVTGCDVIDTAGKLWPGPQGFAGVFPVFAAEGVAAGDFFGRYLERFEVEAGGERFTAWRGDAYDALFLGNFGLPSSALVKASFFREIQGFRDHLRLAEETEFFHRAAAAAPMVLVDAPLVSYRRGSGGSLISSRNAEALARNALASIDSAAALRPGRSDRATANWRTGRQRLLSRLAYTQLSNLEGPAARASFAEAWAAGAPRSVKTRALYAATYLPRWALALMGKLKGVLK